jgi:hypothetical protein
MKETQVAGQLPRPVSQSITDEYFCWQWLPLGEGRLDVKAYFFRNTKRWAVEEASISKLLIFPDPEDAKLVGEALLSAYNWQFIWKEHFVDFILEQDDLENEADAKAFEIAVGPNGPIGACGVTSFDNV